MDLSNVVLKRSPQHNTLTMTKTTSQTMGLLCNNISRRSNRISLIAMTLLLTSSGAFTPSPYRSRYQPTASKTSVAAASAWLFTPERTGAILADTVSDAALKATAAAADVAFDAALVTTDTVVKTVYKAPFLSLALSFLFGGLFFSTVAAGVAAVYAFGKENTRRFKEVAGILWRRNWSVFMMSLNVTRVRVWMIFVQEVKLHRMKSLFSSHRLLSFIQ